MRKLINFRTCLWCALFWCALLFLFFLTLALHSINEAILHIPVSVGLKATKAIQLSCIIAAFISQLVKWRRSFYELVPVFIILISISLGCVLFGIILHLAKIS